MLSPDTPILEEDDFCEPCGGHAHVIVATLPAGLKFKVCRRCFDGGRFQEWFAAELEKILEESPDYERLPDGRYRYAGKE